MRRTFKTVDYDATLDVTIRLGDCLPPDHLARFVVDTISQLDLFVQVLLLAQVVGVLKLGTISLDGTKIHADAFKSKAISYQHLLALQAHLRTKVEQLFALSESARPDDLPDGLVVSDEITRRQTRLARLAEATAILDARAQERTALEQAADHAKVAERAEQARQTGRRPRDMDQYNFTDPDARIMHQSSTDSFEQDYNAQIAVDQASLLIVGESLSNHPTDQHKAAPPADDASPKVKMASTLKTVIGQAIYRVRTCTVEPVIGILKAVLGFRQFSLRGEPAAAGE